jgi:RNA polymerase sigma-70 factor (ECF subfamily)
MRPMSGASRADEEASADLARIYEAYHGKVVAYAAKLLGRAEADDIAQEVFLKIGRSLGDLEDRSKLASWIYAITLNTVRDAVRRRSVTPAGLSVTPACAAAEAEDDSPLEHLPDTRSRTPEETVVRNEMIACYLDYVRQLPRSYYEVYILSELGELPDEAIARRLAVSLGTVKIRLHRARVKLHRQLREHCRCYSNSRGELMGEPRS